MNEPKVSVIVPIFGVEQYISRCARSLFDQSLEEMEFIFVNDATNDNSMEVLKCVMTDYPHRRHQVRIIEHKTNKGLSHARETGIMAATGQYIGHCDSDDWVEKDMYLNMYEKAVAASLDVVKCGRIVSNDEGDLCENPVDILDDTVLTNGEALKRLLIHYTGWTSIWDTIVKRDLFVNQTIRFTDDAMLEDMVVMSQVYMYSQRVGAVSRPYYHYYQNPNSICGIRSEESYLKRCAQARRNLDFIFSLIVPKWGNEFNKQVMVAKCIPRDILLPIMGNTANYLYWKQYYPEIAVKLLFSSYVPLKRRIRFLLVDIHLYPVILLVKNLVRSI